MDGRVKVWNVNEEDAGKREVSLAVSRDLGVVRFRLIRMAVDCLLSCVSMTAGQGLHSGFLS
jgi:hypothetical protein